MKEQELDELIRGAYESMSMSESKIQHILDRMPEKDNVVPFYRREWFSYAAAACIALMIVSVVVSNFTGKVNYVQQTQLAQGVLGIYDHHFEPDVQSSDWNSIATALQHSDFSIVPTNMQQLGNYELRGGRNCAFNGLKAVHVVLYNQNTQKEVCLYVLRDSKEFQKIDDARVNVGGRNVSLWHDNGRMFVLYDPSK